MDNYTTATVSGSESTNGPYQANSEQSTKALTNDDDSYEEYSDDESSMSLGKEILKSVQNNEINKVILLLFRSLEVETSNKYLIIIYRLNDCQIVIWTARQVQEIFLVSSETWMNI